jgi:hypothetical protein
MRTYETRNDLTKLQLAKLEREDPAAYLEYAAKKRKAAKDKEKRDRNDPKCNTGNYQCRGKKGVACIPKSKGCSTDLKNINPARRQYIETIVNGLKAEGAKPKTARIGRKLGAPIVELTPEQYGKALGMNISQLKLMRGDATREQLRAIGVDVDGVVNKPKAKPDVSADRQKSKEAFLSYEATLRRLGSSMTMNSAGVAMEGGIADRVAARIGEISASPDFGRGEWSGAAFRLDQLRFIDRFLPEDDPRRKIFKDQMQREVDRIADNPIDLRGNTGTVSDFIFKDETDKVNETSMKLRSNEILKELVKAEVEAEKAGLDTSLLRAGIAEVERVGASQLEEIRAISTAVTNERPNARGFTPTQIRHVRGGVESALAQNGFGDPLPDSKTGILAMRKMQETLSSGSQKGVFEALSNLSEPQLKAMIDYGAAYLNENGVPFPTEKGERMTSAMKEVQALGGEMVRLDLLGIPYPNEQGIGVLPHKRFRNRPMEAMLSILYDAM